MGTFSRLLRLVADSNVTDGVHADFEAKVIDMKGLIGDLKRLLVEPTGKVSKPKIVHANVDRTMGSPDT